MAVQPKKKKSTPKPKKSIKKKPVRKKTTPKRKKSKSKKKSHTKRNLFIGLTFLVMLSLVAYGYYLGKKSEGGSVNLSDVFETESSDTTKQLLDELTKVKQNKKKQLSTKKETYHETKKYKEVHKTEKKREKPKLTKVEKKVQPAHKPSRRIKPVKSEPKKIVLNVGGRKPKLAIVIDDVSKRSQMRAIHNTGIKLTPSIFPPSELSMNSNHLADGLKHYMIHLPMESGSKQFNSQYKTLMSSFSSAQIENRTRELRKLFPHGRYVNNHTGSVFTANLSAMKKLYKALRDEGFVFIDSRTTAASKVDAISNIYGDPYVARDIFIDNTHTIDAIHTQLKKAVRVAKKKGYAIAIGHPHPITMQALKSANDILKDVELIYIDELYKEQ